MRKPRCTPLRAPLRELAQERLLGGSLVRLLFAYRALTSLALLGLLAACDGGGIRYDTTPSPSEGTDAGSDAAPVECDPLAAGSPCAPRPACTAGASETEACGVNGRGTSTRTCAEGTWQEWSACGEADVCRDGAQDVKACGRNGRGSQVSSCAEGQWQAPAACMDPDLCSDGASEERACGRKGQGKQARACTTGQWSAWSTCDEPAACQEDATEARACGFNQRGQQTRTCSGGQWLEFGACVDGDECKDGVAEPRACGINGRGLETHTCESGHFSDWSACQDSDECKDQSSDTRACGSNGRGLETRTCQGGTFGEFGACVDRDLCTDQAKEERACGINLRGTQSKTCSEGHWGDFGACSDADECRDGDRSERACGINERSKQTRTCSEGHWGDFGECSDADECSDGASEERACGTNLRGKQTKACSEGRWSDFGACNDSDKCRDGDRDEQACGVNGRGNQARTCGEGQWSDFGACADNDECTDAAAEQRACGINDRGNQTRTCSEGRWSDFGACADSDECTDAATEQRACGINNRGNQTRTCSEGRWGDFAACADGDECTDAATEQRACGINSRGSQTRTCGEGQWSEFGACADNDECADAATEQRACGINNRGSQARACSEGRWGDFAACADGDECKDAASEESSCGFNGRGKQTRTCGEGHWSEFTSCVDRDVCLNGASEVVACGSNGRGQGTRTCWGGQWSGVGFCQDPDECADGDKRQGLCGLDFRGRRTFECVSGHWVQGPCSQICGNGTIEAPERCDDGNVVTGDGCSSRCAIEDVLAEAEFEDFFHERIDDGGVLADSGFLGLGFRYGPSTLEQVFVANYDGAAQQRMRLDLGYDESGWIQPFARFEPTHDRLIVSGYLSGKLSTLGLDTQGVPQPFVSSIGATGTVHYAKMLSVNPRSPQDSPRPELAPNGDIVYSGELALGDAVSIDGQVLADARSLDPAWRHAQYVFRMDSEGRVLFSGLLVSTNEARGPGVIEATADRVLVRVPPGQHAAWLSTAGDLEVSESAAFSLNNTGEVAWHHESGGAIIDGVSALPSGETAVTLRGPDLSDIGQRTRILDAMGNVSFEALGAWLKDRSDGAHLLEVAFKGQVTLAEGTPDELVLSGTREGRSVALVTHGGGGELLDARVLVSSAEEYTGYVLPLRDALVNVGSCSDAMFGEGSDAQTAAAGECVAYFDDFGDLAWLHTGLSSGVSRQITTDGEDMWRVGAPSQSNIDDGFEDATTLSHWTAEGALVISEPLMIDPFGRHSFTARVRDGHTWLIARFGDSGTFLPDDPAGALSTGSVRGALVKFRH